MSVAFQITAEGDDFDSALDNLRVITDHLILNREYAKKYAPRNGHSHAASVGGVTFGSVSIEDDRHMQGRMSLRRVGSAEPAWTCPDDK